MCGIFAILNKCVGGFIQKDLEVLDQMGVVTALRGMHSTGLFFVGKEDQEKPKIIKTLGPYHNLMWEKPYKAFSAGLLATGMAVVGHGRHATVGKITKANAHPFVHGHITLVHNGTIRSGLDKPDTDGVEVDSHQLAIEIEKIGVVEALNKIDGAFAIIYHDSKTGNIHIIRNHERPLHYIETALDIRIMSEAEALKYISSRNNYHHAIIQQFEPKVLYTYSPKERRMEKGETVTKVPVYAPYEYKKTVYPVPAPLPKEEHGTKSWDKYENGEEVDFQLLRFSMKDGMYTYTCRDDEETEFFFKTNTKIEAPMCSWGSGIICSVVYDTVAKTTKYQIKTKTIKWSQPGVLAPDAVMTVSGKQLPKENWRHLCKNELCNACNEVVSEDNPQDTFVYSTTEGDKLVCPSCVQVFKDSGYTRIEHLEQILRP